MVRIVSSWFWQTLHDSSECLKWVSHFQLYVDFQLATGHPGPIHCGQWRDGSLMPWLSLQGYGFKQRVRWFTKILKEILRHQGIRIQMGYGLPLSHVLGLHTGMLAVPWPKFHLDMVDQWLLQAGGGTTFRRGSKALEWLPFASRDDALPGICLTSLGF